MSETILTEKDDLTPKQENLECPFLGRLQGQRQRAGPGCAAGLDINFLLLK